MNKDKIRDKALRLIAKKRYTEKELGLKLKLKGCKDGDIAKELDRLKQINLVNDFDYGKDLIYFQTKKSAIGRFLLKKKMTKRGIPSVLCEKLINKYYSEFEEEKAAKNAAKKKIGNKPWDKARLWRFLKGRGFGEEVINKVLISFEKSDRKKLRSYN